MKLRIERWEGESPPSESELRERYRAENLSPYMWSNGPEDTYAAHTHSYHKVIYVVRGSITWILPDEGREMETNAGDRIDLPAGTSHAARVGQHGVTCLEAHRPV